MGHEAQLLRMLEPAVRPGNLPAPARVPTLPVEQRDFESLLQEAAAAGEAGAAESVTEVAAGPLAALADVGRIENPSLRELLSARDSGGGTRMSA